MDNQHISRREALRRLTLMGAASLVACNRTAANAANNSPTPAAASPTQSNADTPTQAATDPGQAYLSVARGEDTAAITKAALQAIGGMERFVKNGYDVIIKPNICVEYHTFEYGATTNPIVVATLVTLAYGAGAKRVRVMDFPFGGTAENAYVKSGIKDAVEAAGGEMEIMNPNKYVDVSIPNAKSLNETTIYRDIMDCDLMIDVPTAKDHSMAKLTIGCKNLLGVIMDRGAIHWDFTQRIPDLVGFVQPKLTIVDAVRTLMDHGPSGGSLDDVKINNTVIASHDVIAADSYATGLFEMTPSDLPYLVEANNRGLGVTDLDSLKIEEINL
jgi:uncharacterized protein (DUF362 family)